MSPNDRKAAGCGPILAGALLVHPPCFALAFAMGFIFGCPRFQIMGAAGGGPVDPAYSLEAGMNAVGTLLALYVLTIGIVPLAISVLGAIMGVRFAARRRQWLKRRAD